MRAATCFDGSQITKDQVSKHEKMSACCSAPAHYAPGSLPASTRWGLSTSNDVGREHPRSLRSFVEDATEVIKTRGNTASLSHACSALLACASRSGEVCTPGPSAGVHTPRSASCGGGLIPSETLETALGSAEQDPLWRRKRGRPALVYETSIETAQKRAYASNCLGVLLSKCNHAGAPQSRGMNDNAVASFVAKMAALARVDTVVLVSYVQTYDMTYVFSY